MKRTRILLLLLVFLLGFGFAGCEPDPIDIDEDPIECEAGYILEGEECVLEEEDPLECDEGFILEDDTCVPEEPEEVIDLSMYDDVTGRYITFFDDFEGDALDETVWEHMLGTGALYGLGYWGNGEAQYYKAENTSVADGELRIQVRREDTVADNGTGTIMRYTSSRIRTKGSFFQTYGRFEARVRFDVAEQGLWPAFWLLPETNEYGGWPFSGEFDILEIRGAEPYTTTAALHYANNLGRHTYDSGSITFPNGTDMTDYHIYALEWTPTRITYFVDDIVVLDLEDWQSNVGDFPSPFDQDFHILLNMAVGGGFSHNLLPSPEALPATMIVDYVRVLALDDENGRKTPEGTGTVYLTLDELTMTVAEDPVDLEFFVFDGSKGDVGWFSSDPSVAVVNQAGTVTPLSPGTTVIRVATGTSEALCTITVILDESE